MDDQHPALQPRLLSVVSWDRMPGRLATVVSIDSFRLG
jgi:hypothetical protein